MRWLEARTGLVLLEPWFLWLALAVAAAVWMRRRRRAPAAVFAPAAVAGTWPRSWRSRLVTVPRVLQVLGLLAVVVALARPVRRVAEPVATEGIDILLCLDTSSSMAQKDMDPQRTRLDLAKAAARTFIAGRPHDRIGLVSFARFPDVACPPTLDHRALAEFLAATALVPGDGPEDATGVGTAVARAADVLRGGSAVGKVVILLTDGEENVATADKPAEIAPLHAAQLCEQLGVRVYAVAAGLGRRAADGAWTALDTGPVRRLSERTGGAFFAARDAGAVDRVYREIDALEKVALDEPRFRIEERFFLFLAGAVVLLVSGRWLESSALAVMP